ncbi:MAG TPA: DUF3305 domain-containing protein [Casimicrobiaceae bacterium]|nr:DUF3305 domain-containing protein [Casimicrobiaceae bacterium]
MTVIMRKSVLTHRWASERWEPVAVEPRPMSDAARVVRVPDTAGHEQWAFEGKVIELHRTEGEGYFLNLVAPEPKVFVMWRMLEPEAMTPGGPAAAPFLVSVSYNEAARLLDGGEQVDGVPMPVEIRRWVEPFMLAHYKPEPRRKVRRRDPLAASDDVAPQAQPPES